MKGKRLIYSHRRMADESYTSVIEVVWEGFLPRVAAPAHWRPPIDIFETASALHVRVEVAGLGDDDFEVELRDELLVISGRRPWLAPAEAAHVHVSEIRYGRFLVQIEVADELRRAPLSWIYERGVLHVVVRKEPVER